MDSPVACALRRLSKSGATTSTIAPRPIFFIHGEQDLFLPDFDELVASAGEPKEVWRLPGVEHTKASEIYPEEFYRRVIGFFERNL